MLESFDMLVSKDTIRVNSDNCVAHRRILFSDHG